MRRKSTANATDSEDEFSDGETTNSSSLLSSLLPVSQIVVTQILDGVISQALKTSVQKSDNWNQLISTVARNPNFANSHDFTDGTLSSEQEEFEQLPSVQKGVCLVPYAFKYDLFNESDTATTSDGGKPDESDSDLEKPKKKRKSQKRKNESSTSEFGKEIDDLGKGKRKRFQNVRMLPIDNVVKSPSRNNTNK